MPRNPSGPRKPRHDLRPPYEAWHHPLPGIPELITLGRDSLRKVVDLREHRHSGAYEICYVERGAVMWWVGDEIHEVKGGDVFVTWPDERHGGIDDVLHPCKSYWIEFDFPRVYKPGWLGLPRREGKSIHAGLKNLPRRRFAGSDAMARLLDSVFAALSRSGPLTAASVRAKVVTLLADVIQAGRESIAGEPISPPVDTAMKLMRQHLEDPLPVPGIAERIGWSTSHFKRQFRREMGVAPAEFYLRLRLAAARKRIELDGNALSQVAAALGFSSSQYLSTCFRRVTGRTPSSFRRRRDDA